MPLRNTLKGIRILDLTSNLPGPFATQILGDMGAEVIKVENLNGDRTRHYPPFIGNESMVFSLLNRNKRSISLDLKAKKGLEIFYKLVTTADVIIEGFRPGTADRLQIGYDSIREIQPKIIYCSLTGYGPNDTRAGHDLNYLAMSGVLHITGPRERPIPPGVQIGDIGGGALPAVISILAALYQRKNEAQYIHVSMTDHLISWLSIVAATYLVGLGEPEREDHFLSGFQPYYRIFGTKDNQFLSFAPLEYKFWKNFCEAIGQPELEEKQFDTDHLNSILPSIFGQRSLGEWMELFEKNDVPGAPILTVKEALNARKAITLINHPSVGKIPLIKSPYIIDEGIVSPPPRLGEDTRSILEEIGYSQDDVEIFEKKGICRPLS